MSKGPDENDRAKAGTLPADPSSGTERAKPALRAVQPGERRESGEPCDLNAERALLGALLWAGQNQPDLLRVRVVLDIMEDGKAFYRRAHGAIYDAIRACESAKIEHDPVAVNAELVKAGTDRSAGGLDGLRALVDEASTVSEKQTRSYAKTIRSQWARRQVIACARRLASDAADPKREASDIAIAARDEISAIATAAAGTGGYVSIGDATIQYFQMISNQANPAMATGLRDFDAATGGLYPSEVSVIAARTSVGKSAFAAQLAEGMVATNDKIGVLYVSLEMLARSFCGRIIAAKAGINARKLRRYGLTQSEWSAFAEAAKQVQGGQLYFLDSTLQTLASIASSARAVSAKLAQEGRRLGMIVVDHIGLVKPSAETMKKANREQQVAETSRGLRYLAETFGCHVMALAQIGREAEKQTGDNTVPKLHHVRESDAIVQDADVVAILHRQRDERGLFDDSIPAVVSIAKARNDQTELFLLSFDAPHVRFVDWNGPETFSDFYVSKRPRARS